MNNEETTETQDGEFAIDAATTSDRFILPEQSALVFDVRQDGDDDVVSVKVVFADGTSLDSLPTSSAIAARAARAVAMMLRGELSVPMETDPTVLDPTE